jgi:hypothetical protein
MKWRVCSAATLLDMVEIPRNGHGARASRPSLYLPPTPETIRTRGGRAGNDPLDCTNMHIALESNESN